MKRGVCFALAASLCLAALPLAAQNRTQGNSKSGTKTSSSAGKSSSAKATPGVKGIFDIATSGGGAKGGSAAPAAGRTSTSASPFGTTSTRTKSSSARRWKTTCKIADCIRENAIPSNTNISISGAITNIVSDGRYTILTMFDCVTITTESGANADVPVTFTVVLDAEVAGNSSLKKNTRKSFTIDSNYVYFVWNDSGCTIRAVDNSLTENPQPATNKTVRGGNNRSNRSNGYDDISF